MMQETGTKALSLHSATNCLRKPGGYLLAFFTSLCPLRYFELS